MLRLTINLFHNNFVPGYQQIYLFIYLSTKILEVNLFAFAYKLFHEDFSPTYGALD